MEGADALGLIAEVGIAIAGFAGVVATLREPGEDEFLRGPSDRRSSG